MTRLFFIFIVLISFWASSPAWAQYHGGSDDGFDDISTSNNGVFLIYTANLQFFYVGDPSTLINPITVEQVNSHGSDAITTGNGIAVKIPSGLDMVWDPSVTTATISGSASSKVSTSVSYADSNKTLLLTVTSDFSDGDYIQISGLKYKSFTGASTGNLGLAIDGAGDLVGNDLNLITVAVPAAIFTGGSSDGFDDEALSNNGLFSIYSAGTQLFYVGDASTDISPITVQQIDGEGASGSITTGNGITIKIPSGLDMVWDSSVTTATISGPASSKVFTTVSYANSNKDLVLTVTSDFSNGDYIQISGLKYKSFTSGSTGNLQLGVDSSADTVDNDPNLITIAGNEAASFAGGSGDGYADTMQDLDFSTSAANIAYLGEANLANDTFTITQNNAWSGIAATHDIRIHIPSSLHMAWDTSKTTATIGGVAAAKVSSTVSYADSNTTLVLDVTNDFANGDSVTVSGLGFKDFLQAGFGYLYLDTGGGNGIDVAADNNESSIYGGGLGSAF